MRWPLSGRASRLLRQAQSQSRAWAEAVASRRASRLRVPAAGKSVSLVLHGVRAQAWAECSHAVRATLFLPQGRGAGNASNPKAGQSGTAGTQFSGFFGRACAKRAGRVQRSRWERKCLSPSVFPVSFFPAYRQSPALHRRSSDASRVGKKTQDEAAWEMRRRKTAQQTEAETRPRRNTAGKGQQKEQDAQKDKKDSTAVRQT